jgi:deoxyribodipyrimidine photo-lyase
MKRASLLMRGRDGKFFPFGNEVVSVRGQLIDVCRLPCEPCHMDRVTQCNTRPVNGHGEYVLYWMTAYRRRHFNFALERAVFWATELRKPLLIFEPLACRYPWANARFHAFVVDGMVQNVASFKDAPVTYMPYVERAAGEGKKLYLQFASRACLIVTDDYPAFKIPQWINQVAVRSAVRVEKVDSNGLFPMRATKRVFLTAHSFRRFLKQQSNPTLPIRDPLAGVDLPRFNRLEVTPETLTQRPSSLDQSVSPVKSVRGGAAAAKSRLKAFISSDSPSSGLSPYLHFGHISVQEVHQAVTLSGRPDSDHFLDELITWRELGFNMCANSTNYDQYSSLPQWARNTLAKHAADRRPVLYSLEQLENAATADDLWNKAQMDLVTKGSVLNRLRMLWGKKIIEWSETPERALEIMIHLNNKYALDGRDPNSYTGIFWTLGRYDRPWGPERQIFGLVRYMSSASTARKLKVKHQ